MTNPQLEDGYTRVANAILEGMAVMLPGPEGVLMAVIRETYGFRTTQCEISHQRMCHLTGIPYKNIFRSIASAWKKKYIAINGITFTSEGKITLTSEGRQYPAYSVNKRYLGSKSPSQVKVIQSPSQVKVITLTSEDTPIKEIYKETTTPEVLKKKASKKPKIELPKWLDLNVWNEFKKFRQSGKGKFTDYAQKLAIGKLEKFRAAGNDPNEVLNQSILNQWTGLYEIKKEIREGEKVKQNANKKLEEYKRLMSL